MTVTYPKGEATNFNMEYYLQTHIPLCARLLASHGYQGYVLHQDIGSKPGADDSAYARIDMIFASKADLLSGLTAHGGEINADIANYTNVKPTMSFSNSMIQL